MVIAAIVGALSYMWVACLGRYTIYVESPALIFRWGLCDYLSIRLISLTVFVVYIRLVASEREFMLDVGYMNFLVIVVAVGLSCILFFRSVSVFSFFFFFESRLVPTAVLVLGWGYQPERLQAGLQMVIYTVCGSLPLLVLLGSICSSLGRDRIILLSSEYMI